MTKRHIEVKRKHHHVWADYLKRWSPNGKDVYHSTERKEKIAFNSVKGIAVTKDFYQIQPIHACHIAMIKEISSKSPTHLQEIHSSYLEDFLRAQKIVTTYENNPIKNQNLDKEIYTLKSNPLENLHTTHENETWGVISSLANRKIDILNNDENMLTYIQFIGHQISRTKTLKDTILASLLKADVASGTNTTKNMNECWWFISYMIGINIGWSLYQSRKEDSHCLLLNDTSIPFITSDQPIINVYKSLQDDKIAPPPDEHCDFYYPITPWVAYMINKSNRFQRGVNHASIDIVNELNIKMARRANVYIVGNSESSLKPLLEYVGRHFKNVLNA